MNVVVSNPEYMRTNIMSVVEITDANFDEVVLGSELPVLCSFGAEEWCSPCRAMKPMLEKLAEEYDGKAVVAKLDVDMAPKTAAKYGVRSVPTIMVFRDAGVSKKTVGMTPREKLVEMIGEVG